MTHGLAETGTEGERRGAELAELVAARICHDVVNPVGAIGNGVDLMQELGAAEAEDMEMVAASAARAAGMLKLHRLAFGPQSPEGEPLARATLAERLEPAFAAGRARLRVEGAEGPALAPPAARLAALMALAGRALAQGSGEVTLTLAGADGLPLSLGVHGPGVGWSAELEALALGRTAARSPREVEFALLPLAARAAGARLRLESGGDRANLEAQAWRQPGESSRA